jgi:hypothetical protein
VTAHDEEDPAPAPAPRRREWRLAGAVFLVAAGVYVATAAGRVTGPTADNHFAHLALGWLEGRLAVSDGEAPPGFNDWACFDTALHDACSPGALQRPRPQHRFFVSFPPFPAVLLLPFVAVFGLAFSDALVFAILAGVAPALLFLLLRDLDSGRTRAEDLLLTAAFAFGSVYYFVAVQGTVWFAAHVVASILLVLFLWGTLGLRSPWLAGVALGCCFLTRPSTAPFALLVLLEAIRVARVGGTDDGPPGILPRLRRHLSAVEWRRVPAPCLKFALPVLLCGGVAMALNQARFEDPFEFGHRFLMIRWRERIEVWGLFNYHYMARNLAIVLASLPWLSATPPYVKVSRHGWALWVTSPYLLWLLTARRWSAQAIGIAVAAAAVALVDLGYQNSGWVQFGYRFSLDYLPALIVLLALGGQRFGGLFRGALALALAVNLFGAVTFNRVPAFYDDDLSQERLFQPDVPPRR